MKLSVFDNIETLYLADYYISRDWGDRVQNSRNNLRAWVRAFPLSEYDQLGDYLLFNAYSAATHTTFGRRYSRQQIRAMQT